jgi:hypothetical protein
MARCVGGVRTSLVDNAILSLSNHAEFVSSLVTDFPACYFEDCNIKTDDAALVG